MSELRVTIFLTNVGNIFLLGKGLNIIWRTLKNMRRYFYLRIFADTYEVLFHLLHIAKSLVVSVQS